jgi:hypothetical protein
LCITGPDIWLGGNWVADFVRDGYVVVPGVVQRAAVERAKQRINNWIASGFDRGRWADYVRWGFAPEIATSPEILGLLNETPVRDIAESLVGQTLELLGDPQIALRFPLAPGEAPARVGCHVDGISDNEVYSFTVLAGVLLSDLPIANGGNFTVWPGTHTVVAQWFQANGTRFEQSSVAYAGLGALGHTSEPRAVCGSAGDLILSHYLLLHGIGAHTGPDIRYTTYFRLRRVDHTDFGDAPLTDPWAEWDGVGEGRGAAGAMS